ncbi:MAG: hypothetical protein JOZ69_02585, partial [Myxococcales bacterium]|nr:hypothetical protein [Myxococcales bacterium]
MSARPPPSSSSLGLRTSVPPARPSIPPAPGSGSLPDARRSVAPPALQGAEGVSIAACAQLLDRLAAADESPFIAGW